MAHIKRIEFSEVSTNFGCTCDRCGQWIKNIWTVEYVEGFTLHYGLDCFEKVYKGAELSAYGEKLLRKIMRYIKEMYQELDAYTSGKVTEDTDRGYQFQQMYGGYWKGKPYEEYKKSMIEVIPKWIENKEKELRKFKNINFDEEAKE